MKSLLLLSIILILSLEIICCYQDLDSYKRNYGLWNNPYNFPNYDVSNNTSGYSLDVTNVQQTSTGFRIPLSAIGDSGLHGVVIQDLIVDVAYETSERLHVKIYDKAQKQIAVPDSPLGIQRPKMQNGFSGGGLRKGKLSMGNDYEFKYSTTPNFSFQIVRKSDGATLFNTTGFPLVFEDQYLEISTRTSPDSNIYGFGEVLGSFKRSRNATTLFARDAHDDYQNMYGTQPFYMDIRNTTGGGGAAHGTFLLNAHGMDIITVEDRITYKVIGGILDFYFFVPQDARPNSVVQAYTTLIGKPMMPALWMLGHQNCRYNYTDIDHVNRVVEGYKENNIPLEVQWVDIDYMDGRKDFTFDPINFPQKKMIALSNMLHDRGQKFVVMVDPAIAVNSSYAPYTRGQKLDIFIKNADGSEYQGQVWPGYTTFPDWWHPNITEYWQKEIVDWMDLLTLDGIWIDMNEPTSFCLGSCGSLLDDDNPAAEPWLNNQSEQFRLHTLQEGALNAMSLPVGELRNLLYPSYIINNGAGNLSEHTIPMTAQHYGNVSHYDLHNLYGHAEGYITREAILAYNSSTRPFLLSRSTFAGSGAYMGHWTGDIESTWHDLKTSIADVLNFQMYGISYSGADICGFVGDATEELCTRWMQLGSFYPFSRNHNNDRSTDQEPYIWPSTAEASRKALAVRYALLPYFYTLFEESSRLGTGVWRPLIFEYPEHANELADNDVQFLIGSDILVSPVVDKGAVSVDAQFPPGIWYDWYDDHQTLKNIGAVFDATLDAPLTHIPVHIRGGSVIVTKTPKLLVKDTYATPYHIIIALDEKNQAYGRLYIDDGYSINPTQKSNVNFIFTGDMLTVNGQFDYPNAESIGNITILSDQKFPFSRVMTSTGKQFDIQKSVGSSSSVIVTDGSVYLDKSFTVKFSS